MESIRKEWDTFSIHCSFVVGDGQQVKFWHDLSCREAPLKGAFSKLFLISRDKEAFVANLLSFPNGLLHWDFHFSRSVQDWELESLTSFMDLLYSLSLKEMGDDQLCWQCASQKGFNVKCYYCYLSPHSLMIFPWKSIWKVKMPPCVAFFS